MHHLRTIEEEIIQHKTLERRNEELLKLLEAWQSKGQNKKPAFIKSLNMHEVENLIIRYYQVYKIPVSLYDEEGKLLFSIGWKNVCVKFHKKNHHHLSSCKESIREISNRIADINSYSFKCSNHINAVAIPILVQNEILGTLVVNQFLYDDENLNFDDLLEVACRQGFDFLAYKSALEELPVYSHAEVESMIEHYILFSEMISFIASHNVQLQEHQNISAEKNEICRIFKEKLDDQLFIIKSIYQFLLQQNQELDLLKSELSMMRKKSKAEYKEKSLVEESQPG
jgi:hypothetical protein